ncbi:ATP-dependent nuclease [Hyphomicrobium sp.]|uniref:ATP-dependent nuclease n=1 Tax=Hyphomicrobium sp. TaxID=82 RepID=UPI002D78EE12|nr:AAA family ATPase [Hyphomicrobium sp.]HET6389852.1 AAA family ATPase [Hyphomicrobium sp.]
MRLHSISLENFRCFRSEQIHLSPYTCIIGANNSGKSTVLKAADIFFRSSQKISPLHQSDFNDPKSELVISLTFSGLPDQPLPGFEHYQRHGKLEFFIRGKIIDGVVVSSIHGRREGIKAFGGFFEGKAPEKKAFYNGLRSGEFEDLPSIPTSAAVSVFESALQKYEQDHPDRREMIESEDLAFGASGVAARLRQYVDWVYIPAVKDAADEDEEAKNTAFGVLIDRIIRAKVQVDQKIESIRATAHDQIKALTQDYKVEVSKLEAVLDQEFRKITSTDAHVHLDWTDLTDENVTLRMPLVRSILSDDSFRGDVSRFGHGLQRNYLLTLVHLNSKFSVENQPSIILAIEEPELYQHPPQARHLSVSLQKISESDQVLITSHSPHFVSARTFDNLRVVRKAPGTLSKTSFWTIDQHRQFLSSLAGEEAIGERATMAKLDQFIQPELSEAFFCNKLVLVEGAEDKAIITALLDHMGALEEFLRCGGHVVAAGGKANLINMIALAQGFSIPKYVIFDADTDCDAQQTAENKTLNAKLVKLLGLPEDPENKCIWPDADYSDEAATIWKENIQSSIASTNDGWFESVKAVCGEFGWNYRRLKKNPSVLCHALALALDAGKDLACLTNSVGKIRAFAKA